MPVEVELELTYLAKTLPKGLKNCPHKELMDLYLPKDADHAHLRVRKNGDKLVITKKLPVSEHDASHQHEHTIPLTEAEFKVLSSLPGKRIRKIRYQYPYQGHTAEIDVFLDDLAGLVLVDFEFKTLKNKKTFQMPEFCLADVTQEDFIAGGVLCGKRYRDIEPELKRFGYKTLMV